MRRAVITGATSGIGEAIARRLAEQGLAVVLVGRSDERLEQTRQRILAAVPGADLSVERVDLALLADVRDLAKRLTEQPLPEVVISNAAVIADLDDLTGEGLPLTLATNHLAPYLLLRSLVGPLTGRQARFVVVGASPTALARVPVDLDDLRNEHLRRPRLLPSFRPFVAYGRTKNMNAMFVYALARRLAGTGVTVNGAHPGIIANTGLGRDARGLLKLFAAVQERGGRLPGPDTGADTPAWLATAREVDGVTGRFFVDRREVTTAAHTTDPARCDRLWDESARLVGLPAEL